MLESPDYFFRVREIGRLRQTRTSPVYAIRYCTRTRRMQFVWARTLREIEKRGVRQHSARARAIADRVTGKAWVPKLSMCWLVI